ncbi:hypothetical protein Scep_019057 [Stephania cephalantha]|uniref:Uncharacterized protein n=1 Tax=Stephania cephalantha TaxID=152367 RepID=A0AAP0IA69_9MAGN
MLDTGHTTFDYVDLYMEFMHQGKLIRLQGVRPASCFAMSFSQFKKLEHQQGAASYYQCSVSLIDQDYTLVEPSIPPLLQGLLDDFSDVFASPTSLPPSRTADHHIPIQPGTQPINVKPSIPAFPKKKGD